MRSTERFTGLATIYGQARPTYPQELVRWCLEQVPTPGLIVDLGCGTGISTRLFASTGHPVPPTQTHALRHADHRLAGAWVSDLRRHPRDLRQHTRDLRQHTRDLRQHTRDLRRHTRDLRRHTRDQRRHTRDLRRHTRDLRRHTRDLRQHTRDLRRHTRDLRQHTRDLRQHTRDLRRHTRDLRQHTRDLRQHTRDLRQHTRDLRRHPCDVRPVRMRGALCPYGMIRSPQRVSFGRTEARYDHQLAWLGGMIATIRSSSIVYFLEYRLSAAAQVACTKPIT